MDAAWESLLGRSLVGLLLALPVIHALAFGVPGHGSWRYPVYGRAGYALLRDWFAFCEAANAARRLSWAIVAVMIALSVLIQSP